MPPTVTAPEVQALFDRIAPVYDQLNDWLSLGLHRVWKKMAVKWSQARPGQQVLDVCCGSGDLALLLARQVGPTGAVIGIDFAPAQLEIAQQRAQAWGLHHLTWLQGDALALPIPSQTIEAATLGYGLRNVADIDQCLRELHRVLKPGAWVAILDFSHPETQWGQQFQAWYLDQIVVPCAASYGVIADYEYLLPSIQRFPKPNQLKAKAKAAGLENIRFYPLLGGLMGVLVGQRPQ